MSSLVQHLIMMTGLAMVVLTQSTNAQNQPTTSDPSQRIQHLMDIEVGFKEMIPPGMSIEAEEISRKGKSGEDLVVQYHIFVKESPPDALFEEIQWPVNADKASAVLTGISVGKDGILMCAGRKPEQCGDPRKPDDPIEFITVPKRGEPIRLAFVSQDVRIGTVIVPDPVESTDKGCTLSAVRLTPRFELAFLSGSGYAPNTDVHYRVSSAGKIDDRVVKSDRNGTIRTGLIPYPGGKKNGTVLVKIQEAKCSPEIVYDWGTI